MLRLCWCVLVSLAIAWNAGFGDEVAPSSESSPAQRGLWYLLQKQYLARDIHEQDFADIWKVWPKELRQQAELATPADRRAMAFLRYGFVEMPGRSAPMGFVPGADGSWAMNCLACHGGQIEGQPMPGLPNSNFAMQTWAQDMVAYRVQIQHQPRSRFAASLAVPLSRSNGTTNAQIFSVVFTTLRDSDLNMRQAESRHVPKMLHHDLDAPPFWNVKKKRMMYIDGYVEKSHRVIMQFVLLPSNKAETIRGWENDFRDVLAFIESVPSPVYKGRINRPLAERGRIVFEANCSSCHGTYGVNGRYPEKTVPIDEIETDRRRLDGMPLAHREFFKQGWMGEEGEVSVVDHPIGYVAPPLDGIWASAPYLHNGSVPTLWHLLHPNERPRIWKRTSQGFDHQRIGLEVTEMESIPAEVDSADERRAFFDASLPGKSAAGHDFPEALSEDERLMVLEYLKSL
ncbi:cytochrome c [bacterium]|nr:cytochrome c [bacterium]